jgi:hypothetical protein
MTLFDQDIQDPNERWRPWEYAPPPLNWLYLEIWRREWPGPRIITPAEVSPEMNVAGLYWRTP